MANRHVRQQPDLPTGSGLIRRGFPVGGLTIVEFKMSD
jgi:hypothetical protein